MKKNELLKFEIINCIFVTALGFFLHFTYDLSNANKIIGIFSPINESIWEHLKLVFFPMLITIMFGYPCLKDTYKNFLLVKTKQALLSQLIIVVFYYTYTGILGIDIALVNITCFIVAIIIGHIYSYNKLNNNSTNYNKFSSIILIINTLLFLLFTFNPPLLNIFKDPVTHTYGIYKYTK